LIGIPNLRKGSYFPSGSMFDQYGRDANQHHGVNPAIPLESATWTAAGELDYWVRNRAEWWGRVRGPDGHHVWKRASDLRRVSVAMEESLLVARQRSPLVASKSPHPSFIVSWSLCLSAGRR
jgi:hypothetical protein